MRLTALLTSLVAAGALAIAIPGAGAAGGPVAPAILVGGQGVLAPDGKVRYVALTTGRQTIVSVVRVRGGQVVGWRLVPGYFGVPVIAIDGKTDGVSRDGRKLVLATSTGGKVTQFALIDTKTFRLRRVALPGSWSFDAISPDATMLFLVQYSGAGPNASYRVRAYDVAARRLLPTPIVDRTVGAKLMHGQAVTRATTGDGRWAYTLYARAKHEPFVHALDTMRRKAFCIDLPIAANKAKQLGLRLRLRRSGTLDVRNGRETVAVVDTRTFEVHTH